MKMYEGKDIREVWNFRLSEGSPILYNNGKYWRAVIYAKKAPDGESVILAEHTTDVPVADVTLEEGQAACYKWLYSVRDKFALPGIELRKPVVAKIEAANERINQLMTMAAQAEKNGDVQTAYTCRGEASTLLVNANAEIKQMSEQMHKDIAKLGEVA